MSALRRRAGWRWLHTHQPPGLWKRGCHGNKGHRTNETHMFSPTRYTLQPLGTGTEYSLLLTDSKEPISAQHFALNVQVTQFHCPVISLSSTITALTILPDSHSSNQCSSHPIGRTPLKHCVELHPLLPTTAELDQPNMSAVGGVVIGKGQRGGKDHVSTLSMNLECDPDHGGIRAKIDFEMVTMGSIVGHNKSVADINTMQHTTACRGRKCESQELEHTCTAHCTSHHLKREASARPEGVCLVY